MKYLADYTIEFAGELLTGIFRLPGNQIPEEGDIIRLPIEEFSTPVRVDKVHVGAERYGVQYLELICSLLGGSPKAKQ